MAKLLQGFSVAQLTVALLLGKNKTLRSDPETLSKTLPFSHTISDSMHFPSSAYGGRVVADANAANVSTVTDLCPTLRQCLMYQACVFNFGNEFCSKDPWPGRRKNVDVNITCVKVLFTAVLLLLLFVCLFFLLFLLLLCPCCSCCYTAIVVL